MYRVTLAPGSRWGPYRRAVGIWLVVALALGTVAVPEAWAADYYVDTSGSDAADGSQATPWKTLTHALGQVTSGDVVHLAAGTYDTPGNGETFPLALVDGVTILGDTANPGSVVISAPAASQVFSNNDTQLLSSTRLAGVTLKHDASSGEPLMQFAVDTAQIMPQIDHNVFQGTSANDNGISYFDVGAGAGRFTPTIDNNTFTDLDEAIILTALQGGAGQVFSPVITNNTFTGCDYPVNYSMASSAEGTVGGLVAGNTFTGTGEDDVYVSFSPISGGSGLVFNPTITGNDMQSGASTNVYAGLYGYAYMGDATFAPTITDNQMDASYRNVYMYGYYTYMDGDYTVAPTISGNTMTGASYEGVSLYLTTLSVWSSAERNVISPTITNNSITTSGGDGVYIYLSDWSQGQLEGTATIAGNTISGANDGVYWAMSYMYNGDGMDWSIAISNNTITSPSSAGISFSMESMSFTGTGVFNLTMEGNTISGAASDGMYVYPAYSWYSDNQITETVLIRGNTVTGSAGDGIWLYFSDQTSNTLDARITDNVLSNNGDDGLDLESNDLGSNGILVACNSITGNTDNGIEQGAGYDPPADYGGGNLGSPGGNTLTGNGGFDFSNQDTDPVMAENNWWGSTVAATIDGNISDDDEGAFGAVDFEPFLSAAPVPTVSAQLSDTLAVDVAPPGASPGDLLQYTAQISVTSVCGDVDLTFTATVDPNTTVMPGSVTTTKGTVQSENPPTVDIGYVEGSETVTVTWQVLILDNGETSVESQGTVTGSGGGTTVTDDPDTGTTGDPTVTDLSGQPQQVPGIPTLGQWGLALFTGLLLLLGVGLLRRRRWAGGAAAVLLAVALAAAPVWAAGSGKAPRKEMHATTVASFSVAQGMAELGLADGSSVRVPLRALVVHRGHVKPPRDEARSQRPTRAERRAERARRKAEHSRAARLAMLQTGTPVLVTVKLDRHGQAHRVVAAVFDTLEQAQAELARKQAGRKHPRE